MPTDAKDLQGALRARLGQLGLSVGEKDGTVFGSQETILAKWLLGGRKSVYSASCRVDDERRAVHFREAVMDQSWGVAPPTMSVEKTSIQGRRLSGSREEKSVGGGGKVDYARVREAVEQLVAEAGWTLDLEVGLLPEGGAKPKFAVSFGSSSSFGSDD